MQPCRSSNRNSENPGSAPKVRQPDNDSFIQPVIARAANTFWSPASADRLSIGHTHRKHLRSVHDTSTCSATAERGFCYVGVKICDGSPPARCLGTSAARRWMLEMDASLHAGELTSGYGLGICDCLHRALDSASGKDNCHAICNPNSIRASTLRQIMELRIDHGD